MSRPLTELEAAVVAFHKAKPALLAADMRTLLETEAAAEAHKRKAMEDAARETAGAGGDAASGVPPGGFNCRNCGNVDQGKFDVNAREGDVVCQACGLVVLHHTPDEGDSYRKMEGEEDRSHFGRPTDARFSGGYNLRTDFAQDTEMGRELAKLQSYIELDLSNMTHNRGT